MWCLVSTTTAAIVAALRLIDADRSAVQFRTTHLVECRISRRIFSKSDEAESTATSRVAVQYNLRLNNLTKTLERIPKTGFSCCPSQTAYK